MYAQLNRSFPGMMFVLAGVAALGVSTSASADSLEIFGDTANSTEGIADFTGMLTYDFVLGDMGVLTVDLTNVPFDPLAGNGDDDELFLTAFVFNIGSDDMNAAAVLTSTTNPFFLDAQMQSGVPFGDPFVGGAGLMGEFLRGGDPKNGLGLEASGTFMFDITAADAESLSAASFLQGPYDFNFTVRFRGEEDGFGFRGDDDGDSDNGDCYETCISECIQAGGTQSACEQQCSETCSAGAAT